MIVATSLAAAFLLLSALTALRPGRRGVFHVLAFPVGWAAGELPGQAILAAAGLVALQWWWGWPRAPWSDVLVVIVSAGVAANVVLVIAQLGARRVTARAMASAPVHPLAIGGPRDDEFGRWWRTLVQFPFHPRCLHVTRDVGYGAHALQRLDVWQIGQPEGAPVALFVHGGAWVIGDKREQGRPMLHEFVSRGWIAVSVNYRLASVHPWPAAMEDVTRALWWVKENIALFGGDPSRVVVAGASAGGQLAALLALSADDPTWRPPDAGPDVDWRVRGCISQYGVLEMTGDPAIWDGHGAGLRSLLEDRVVQVPVAGHEELYRSLSPIERITAAAPPFLVIQGGNDTLVDVHVARHFVARFRAVAAAPIYHVELPLTQHAFDVTASLRTSAATRAEVAFGESVVAPVSSDESPVRG